MGIEKFDGRALSFFPALSTKNMVHHMTILELEAFIAAVETGSLSQAASRLGRVQSSISLRIKQLETELGVTILDRSYDGIVPTEAGKDLYRRASDIISRINEIKESIATMKEDSDIKIGLIEVVPTDKVNQIIKKLKSANIRYEIKFGMTENLINMIENDDLDFAIMGSGYTSPSLIHIPLYTEQLVLISSPGIQETDVLSTLDHYDFYVHSKKVYQDVILTSCFNN
ncbi:LysR family transcriptional regulator [Allorhizobium sp. BGMRC 0089]|uniref:LysR family transcriptional regulator n=1 Tax=Allorhizobium sonneratiae TaxID=2934936 RepID=UPI00203371B2|nr:LysR family transcriptional regulator [Allorhizobium sonneratiae]MCM2292038.1 LysR family transcriptional regulator [Allorhizobium sonneratiae]